MFSRNCYVFPQSRTGFISTLPGNDLAGPEPAIGFAWHQVLEHPRHESHRTVDAKVVIVGIQGDAVLLDSADGVAQKRHGADALYARILIGNGQDRIRLCAACLYACRVGGGGSSASIRR